MLLVYACLGANNWRCAGFLRESDHKPDSVRWHAVRQSLLDAGYTGVFASATDHGYPPLRTR